MAKLKEEHGIQISYNEALVSTCFTEITEEGTLEEKLDKFLSNCKLSYDIIGSVYVIVPVAEVSKKHTKKIIRGKVIDRASNEPLPFSTVQINGVDIMADVNGMFAYESQDSILAVKASYLGYYVQDTSFTGTKDVFIFLQSKVEVLNEVVIESRKEDQLLPIENRLGVSKINRSYASYLPGNRDNAVFNMLRLQPGIMASGEQSSDYFIWGSYRGHSHIVFDGITLFTSGSLSENIGAVNPLVIQDVEVHKGGYNVGHSDRVGGYINITSNQGDTAKFSSTISLNDQISSATINIPLSKKSVLQTSLRSTTNLFNKMELVRDSKFKRDYKFFDLNLKYTAHLSANDKIYISMLSSSDDVMQELSFKDQAFDYRTTLEKSNQQNGMALSYVRNGKHGGITNFVGSYSKLNSAIIQSKDVNEVMQKTFVSDNQIGEQSIRVNHRVRSKKKISIELGGGLVNNSSIYDQDDFVDLNKTTKNSNVRMYGFYKNTIRLSSMASLQPGVKIEIPANTFKTYIQPRLQLKVDFSERINLNSAIGRYVQFINELSIVDDDNNRFYYWDASRLKPITSNHFVIDTKYKGINSAIKLEGYYRTLDGVSRFVSVDNEGSELVESSGEGVAYGFNIQLNKELKQHHFWASHTWGHTKERFSYYDTYSFLRAPQDQRHEFKTGGILNFRPFYFSYGYVYGSGFPYYYESIYATKTAAYSRLDVSGMYRFNLMKVKLEVGMSVLNLFNTQNVRFNDFSNFPNAEQPQLWASQFTLVFSLNLRFNN